MWIEKIWEKLKPAGEFILVLTAAIIIFLVCSAILLATGILEHIGFLKQWDDNG